MSDILSRIVDRKKEEIAEALNRMPEVRLRAEAEKLSHRRGFFLKLKKPGPSGINVIAEVKRASPSKGVLRANLNPAELARTYQEGGAAAVSVLTDRHFFQGSFDDLRRAREAVSLPVLRKDFLISSYQIYESALLGADAVLLIVRILSLQQLTDYLALSHELGLDVLTEVHSQEEIETATLAGATLIGINNRNLKSFSTDTGTSANLVRFLEPHQIAVAESGIRTKEDIMTLKQAGIWNFLIGESLVTASDPKTFLKSLA